MEPSLVALAPGVAKAIQVVAELMKSRMDNVQKVKLELVGAKLETIQYQADVLSRELETTKQRNRELSKEVIDLSEKVATYELGLEYENRDGMLYKRNTEEGPYCQIDRVHMLSQGSKDSHQIWKCPKCQAEGRILDPSLIPQIRVGRLNAARPCRQIAGVMSRMGKSSRLVLQQEGR